MIIDNVYFPDRPYIKSMFITTGKNNCGIYINLLLIDNSVVQFNWRAKHMWLYRLDTQYL